MNRNKKFFSSVVLVLLMLVIWFTDVAYSASEKVEKVAEVMIGSSGISWQPRVNYGQLIVNVARPDGSVFSKTFEAGTNPYLDLSAISAGNYSDGSYTYELRVIPFISTKVRGESSQADGTYNQETLTQTGHFLVQGGSIVSQNSTEDVARPMDVVHADDVIVTGSICVGYDCLTDGTETFGFDTIKMKENNIRIFFDDTSVSAGFPANDWRIVANDATSGGGNYLAFEDSTGAKTPFKVEAGARNNALYVNSSGRVGLGTSTPVLNLHIAYGDSPAFRLEQDTSYGWTAQSWDISGNESNFFVRDVTGGSKLPFRIQPGTPTNTLTLKSDGNVGIGTWSPGYPLEVDRTGENACIFVKRTDGASNYVNATDSYANFGSTTNHPLRLVANNNWRMMLNTDNSLTMANGASCTAGGTWTNASSRALKENIQELNSEEALAALNDLYPVKFNYKADKEEKHVGFIAEDVPQLVASKDKKSMSPMDVVAVLTKVVQEQQKSILDQQKIISELKTKIAQLEKK